MQDCPPDHELEVTRLKETSTVCSMCFYIQRGSFAGSKQEELVKSMAEHESIADKSLGHTGCCQVLAVGACLLKCSESQSHIHIHSP